MEEENTVSMLVKGRRKEFMIIVDNIIEQTESLGMETVDETFGSFTKDLIKFIAKHFFFVRPDGEH